MRVEISAPAKSLAKHVALMTAILIASAAGLQAGTTANMVLTSPGSTETGTNVLDGVYVGAYTATINGVSTPVICDDFADESYLNDPWQASVYTYSDLSQALWASSNASNYTTLYDEAAWLAEQMLLPANQSQIGEIQFAIWGVFDSSAISELSSYSGTDGSEAQNWLNDAASNTYYVGEFSNVTVYTPDPTNKIGKNVAQEFLVVGAPEPSQVATLAADLLLFVVAVMVLRRKGLLTMSRNQL